MQYFDKARMELNAPGGPVTAGLLSVELITGRQQNGDATFVARQPAKVTVAGAAADRLTVNVNNFVPELPSVSVTSLIESVGRSSF